MHGTLDTLTAPVEDMGVNHGGLHVLVPQEFLHCPDVVAAIQELRGKRMSKGMACGTFQFYSFCFNHSTKASILFADTLGRGRAMK